MMPRTYRWYFRMREDCVNGLTRFLNPQIRIHPGGREQTDHKKMVAMTLFWMGNESTYKHIATTFGVTENTFIRCTEYIVKLLVDKSGELIKWPWKDQLPQLAAEFDAIGR